MAERVFEQIWNQYDELGLLVGLTRIPGEGNLEFRQRILNHETYDSTEQGLVNHVSEALLGSPYTVQARKIFTSLRQPLSLAIYQTIDQPPAAYYAPRIKVGATTYIIEASADAQKDTITSGSTTWTLWKQPDGSYDRIWTATVAPDQDIELFYQWSDGAGELHAIHESAKILTWVDGAITEDYPEEDR